MRVLNSILHGRPQCLEAHCNGVLSCPELAHFHRWVFSVDPGHANQDKVVAQAKAAADAIAASIPIPCEVCVNTARAGVDEHPRIVLERAFGTYDADTVVCVEDDGVLKPDALRLALWFEEASQFGEEHILLSMCNHRDFGKSPKFDEGPWMLAEASHITSPFAWATTRHFWPFIRANWNTKQVNPKGWDWSLSYDMRMGQRLCFHPVISRCQNIGREDGAHESPESFDKTQLGIRYQEEYYSGEYSVAVNFDREQLRTTLSTWMLPEWELRNNKKWEGATTI